MLGIKTQERNSKLMYKWDRKDHFDEFIPDSVSDVIRKRQISFYQCSTTGH